MKTLCIKEWKAFKKGKVYDVTFTDVNKTPYYIVYYSSNVYSIFHNNNRQGKHYNEYFSHEDCERKMKLEKILCLK